MTCLCGTEGAHLCDSNDRREDPAITEARRDFQAMNDHLAHLQAERNAEAIARGRSGFPEARR
jgi:hypothetical protein